MKNIYSRGNPDQKDVVHFPGGSNKNMSCYTGSYNVRFSFDKAEVTCPKCKEKIRGG